MLYIRIDLFIFTTIFNIVLIYLDNVFFLIIRVISFYQFKPLQLRHARLVPQSRITLRTQVVLRTPVVLRTLVVRRKLESDNFCPRPATL